MRKSHKVALGVTATAALAIGGMATLSAAAGPGDPEYYGICVDPQTNQRLDDDQCDRDYDGHSHSSFFVSPGYRGGWHYYPYNTYVPPVGSAVTSPGAASPPAGQGYYNGGASRSGGQVKSSSDVAGGKKTSSTTRGGFGSKGSKGSS